MVHLRARNLPSKGTVVEWLFNDNQISFGDDVALIKMEDGSKITIKSNYDGWITKTLKLNSVVKNGSIIANICLSEKEWLKYSKKIKETNIYSNEINIDFPVDLDKFEVLDEPEDEFSGAVLYDRNYRAVTPFSTTDQDILDSEEKVIKKIESGELNLDNNSTKDVFAQMRANISDSIKNAPNKPNLTLSEEEKKDISNGNYSKASLFSTNNPDNVSKFRKLVESRKNQLHEENNFEESKNNDKHIDAMSKLDDQGRPLIMRNIINNRIKKLNDANGDVETLKKDDLILATKENAILDAEKKELETKSALDNQVDNSNNDSKINSDTQNYVDIKFKNIDFENKIKNNENYLNQQGDNIVERGSLMNNQNNNSNIMRQPGSPDGDFGVSYGEPVYDDYPENGEEVIDAMDVMSPHGSVVMPRKDAKSLIREINNKENKTYAEKKITNLYDNARRWNILKSRNGQSEIKERMMQFNGENEAQSPLLAKDFLEVPDYFLNSIEQFDNKTGKTWFIQYKDTNEGKEEFDKWLSENKLFNLYYKSNKPIRLVPKSNRPREKYNIGGKNIGKLPSNDPSKWEMRAPSRAGYSTYYKGNGYEEPEEETYNEPVRPPVKPIEKPPVKPIEKETRRYGVPNARFEVPVETAPKEYTDSIKQDLNSLHPTTEATQVSANGKILLDEQDLRHQLNIQQKLLESLLEVKGTGNEQKTSPKDEIKFLKEEIEKLKDELAQKHQLQEAALSLNQKAGGMFSNNGADMFSQMMQYSLMQNMIQSMRFGQASDYSIRHMIEQQISDFANSLKVKNNFALPAPVVKQCSCETPSEVIYDEHQCCKKTEGQKQNEHNSNAPAQSSRNNEQISTKAKPEIISDEFKKVNFNDFVPQDYNGYFEKNTDNPNDIHREKLSSTRIPAVKSMILSQSYIPPLTISTEVDMTSILKLKHVLKKTQSDVMFTTISFITKAISTALKEYPKLNSSYDPSNNEIIVKSHHNIGLATETNEGLIVPVLKLINKLSIKEIAIDIQEMTSRLRKGELYGYETSGSTITLANYGSIGATQATPTIFYPNAAVVGIGKILKKPMVSNNDKLVIKAMMNISLTVDQRIIDSVNAGNFLNYLKEILESPEILTVS